MTSMTAEAEHQGIKGGVKERPILFSGEMVRAILAGNKTQTRRVVKPQPKPLCVGHCPATKPCFTHDGLHCMPSEYCPYGRVADRLWVRETWRPIHHAQRVNETYVRYFVDDGLKSAHHTMKMDIPMRWRPSIHMPRWASRILLEITAVRVERLQDISIMDAISEGVRCPDCGYRLLDALAHADHAICVNKWLKDCKAGMGGALHPAQEEFGQLWDSINGKTPGKTWDDNPWVWVIEFKKIT